MEHQLNRGQALVITGPQGCGKSTLARSIAKRYGTFREVEASRLNTAFGFAEAMFSEPDTLIVDGLPEQEQSVVLIKEMITNDSVMMERRGLTPKSVKTPNFIFCTGDADPLPFGDRDRRFWVVKL